MVGNALGSCPVVRQCPGAFGLVKALTNELRSLL